MDDGKPEVNFRNQAISLIDARSTTLDFFASSSIRLQNDA